VALGAQREDVEDQAAAIDDPHGELAFEVALLAGRQFVVEDDQVRLMQQGGRADFTDLALAGEGRGIGTLATAGDDGQRLRAGAGYQQAEFFQSLGKVAFTKIQLHEYGFFAGGGPLKHGPAPEVRASLDAVFLGDIDGPGGDDGGYRVLVHHLGDGVLQQHDVLIEGLYLTLQLDAVDEIDRHRHVLAPQRVQERVL